MADFRIERDSMGEVKVPASAKYAAQTQRAIENFPIHGCAFPRPFIRALGLIKAAAATVNADSGMLDNDIAAAIISSAMEVAEGKWDEHFPIVVYQTGSGTSSNMNANEVIATLASERLGANNAGVHPNDHVNMGQSSNDVIPTAIHVSSYLEVKEHLLPELRYLQAAFEVRAVECKDIIKTGRTHLMDAMPMSVGQEIGAWAYQTAQSIERIESTLPRLARLAQGGTAVGTGINAAPGFGAKMAAQLAKLTDIPFVEAQDHFAAQASQDTAAELSGQLKTSATAFFKICNDLRHLNSGPIAGLGEIALPSLQPGSSIMPGKVNPVIPEAMIMVSAQIIGNDTTIAISNAGGNFQLNVMLPIIAHNLLESIALMASAARTLADKAIKDFKVNEDRINELINKNPILVTALNPVIGYDLAAKIAKKAYAEGRALKDVAKEMTDLTDEELDRHLNPRSMI
jgi:fumarate hydratase class II